MVAAIVGVLICVLVVVIADAIDKRNRAKSDHDFWEDLWQNNRESVMSNPDIFRKYYPDGRIDRLGGWSDQHNDPSQHDVRRP